MPSDVYVSKNFPALTPKPYRLNCESGETMATVFSCKDHVLHIVGQCMSQPSSHSGPALILHIPSLSGTLRNRSPGPGANDHQ